MIQLIGYANHSGIDRGSYDRAGAPALFALLGRKGAKTFTSPHGFAIDYPADWTAVDCFDGTRVILFASSSVQYDCYGVPPSNGALTILGPLAPSDEEKRIGLASNRRVTTVGRLEAVKTHGQIDDGISGDIYFVQVGTNDFEMDVPTRLRSGSIQAVLETLRAAAN